MMLSAKYKDKYSFIADPDGTQPGDACWQTGWLYFAYCVLGHHEWQWRHVIENYDADPIRSVGMFLSNYYERCCFHDSMISHPDRPDHCTRDHLVGLIILMFAVCKYQKHLMKVCKPIIAHIIMLDAKNAGSLHSPETSKDDLNNSVRYVLKRLCDAYDLSYPHYGSEWFTGALKTYEALNEVASCVPSGIANFIKKKIKGSHNVVPRPYTVWNNLGLLTALKMVGQATDVQRDCFSYFADNGWGAAYNIVAKKPVSDEQIGWYNGKQTEYIDIIQQRGKKEIYGSKPALDYPITLAIREVWA